MARGIDVYQLLCSFAQRNGLGEINYRSFAQAVQRMAHAADQTETLYRDLNINPDLVLVPRLFLLAKERKVSLATSDNEISTVYLPDFFSQAFAKEYRRMDESLDIPFPDEDSLKTAVPGEWIQSIPLDTDLGAISDSPGERDVPLFRIIFPDGLHPIVIPSSYVPDKILEYAVLKLRYFVRKEANKDYMYNKLAFSFPGKENQLKDALDQALTRPHEALEDLRRADSDFVLSFWGSLVAAIRKDLDKKGEKTPEDISIQQSALICEFYANHFKGKAQRRIEREAALKAFDIAVRKPPYHFSIEEIQVFRDSKGVPLLGSLTGEDIEARLREKATRSEDGLLPELLVLPTKGRRAYVAKDRALLLAVHLINEARSDLRARILERWRKALEEYLKLPPMDEDQAFQEELSSLIETRFPLLDAFFSEGLLPLIATEMAGKGELPADIQALFYKGELIPLDELLDLNRKGLLADARMLLPFWYSISIFTALARFFRRLGAGRERASTRRPSSRKAEGEKTGAAKADIREPRESSAKVKTGPNPAERRAEFAAAATKIARELTPAGQDLEGYLHELEGRWNTILNPEAKANLVEDVNSLVRDYLRSVVRSMGGSSLTLERVKNLASTLADSGSLTKIKNHQALEAYIQLYMMKVLGARIGKP